MVQNLKEISYKIMCVHGNLFDTEEYKVSTDLAYVNCYIQKSLNLLECKEFRIIFATFHKCHKTKVIYSRRISQNYKIAKIILPSLHFSDTIVLSLWISPKISSKLNDGAMTKP